MKYLLTLSILWTFQARAQSACGSIWIFKANNTCAHPSHGVDKSKPTTTVLKDEESGFGSGQKHQDILCAKIRDRYNAANPNTNAALAQPTPVAEKKEKVAGFPAYNYWCRLSITSFENATKASPACGTAEKWSYQVEGERPAGANCLSCDDVANAKVGQTAKCLVENIRQIIEPKAVELRDQDLAAVKAQAAKVVRLNKATDTLGMEELNVLINFVEQK